jgi:hemerythrin
MKWWQDLETGIEEIDRDHRELFVQIDEFLQTCRNANWEKVKSFFALLENHATQHVLVEERLLQETGYPHYEDHKAIHDQLRGKIIDMKSRFRDETLTLTLIFEVKHTLVEGLSHHIYHMDKPFARFLKDQRSAKRTAPPNPLQPLVSPVTEWGS